MNTFLRIDINIVAFIMLGAILMIAVKRLDSKDALNKAYFRVGIIVMLQLFFETSTCIINRREGLWLIPLSYFLHICLYISGAILAYNGYILVHQMIFPNKKIEKKRNILLIIPLIINTILTLASPKLHLVFYINEANIYQRGNYFIFFIIITYMYMVLMLILIISNRKKLFELEFVLLLMFCILPMLGGIIQVLYYGTLFIWSSLAFSLIIIYSYMQQRMVQLDYLTGVWSRGSFEFYIKNRLDQRNNKKLGIIYCDIDGLKEINDNYGHMEGDYAIKTATQIMRKALRKTDIMVRMGGDEFIILLECDSLDILDSTLDVIETLFLQYNETSIKSYKLSCSFGSDLFNSNYSNIEQFIHHVDSIMYTNKKQKKDSI